MAAQRTSTGVGNSMRLLGYGPRRRIVLAMRRIAQAVCLCLHLSTALGGRIAHAQHDPLAAERGYLALRAGDAASAYALLAPAARAPNAAPEVRFWAADAAAALGRMADAQAHLTDLEAELPAVADEVWARRARALTALSQLPQAIAAWETVRRLPHGRELEREAAFAIGPLWLAQQNPLAAIMALRAASQAHPQDGRSDNARLQIAQLEEAQGNLRGALALYAQLASAARDPTASQAAQALHALQERIQTPHTEAPAQPLASADEQASWKVAHTLRDAQRLVARREGDAAVALLQQVLRTGGSAHRHAAMQELGNTYVALGRSQQAIATFDQLVAIVPPGTVRRDAQYRAAYLTYDAGLYPQAAQRFAHWLVAHPRAPAADEALWYMAWCAYHAHKPEDALVHLGRLRQQFARSHLVARAEYWSGRILAERHRDAEADRAFTAAAARQGYYGAMARLRQREFTARSGLRPAGPTVQALNAWNDRARKAVAAGEAVHAPAGAWALAPTQPPALTQVAASPLAASTLGPRVQSVALARGAVDDAILAEVLTEGSQVLNWETLEGARVSTLIRLGLLPSASVWVGALRGLPGTAHAAAALGRAQVAYALGDYTGAMRHAALALPSQSHGPWSPKEAAAMRLAYPPAHAPHVVQAAQRYDVSDLLILSVMRRESAFNPRAASRVSAQGLMQIMPSTGRRIAQALQVEHYDDAQLTEPAINIGFAAWYLRALIDKFDGNLAVAIGSYNAGPAVSEKWLHAHAGVATDVYVEDIPYRETRDYIKNVLANLEMYHRIYDGGFMTLPATVPTSVGNQVNF